jgi:mono/diheme cytochrome c family protein
MMRRRVACAMLLLLAAGCKHTSVSAPALKPTAAGTTIVESSGGKQSGPVGMTLKDPLVVQVNDQQGTAVPGALVEFHGTAGVHFEPASMLTDSSGQATTAVTLGTIAGRYELSATTAGKSQPATIEIAETALGYQQQLGSILGDKYCSRCHDPESSAERVSNYDNLEVKPHPFTDGATLNKMSDADLTAIIAHGGPALNRSALMPPYSRTLNPAEVQAIIAYIRVVADPPFQPTGTVYAQK